MTLIPGKLYKTKRFMAAYIDYRFSINSEEILFLYLVEPDDVMKYNKFIWFYEGKQINNYFKNNTNMSSYFEEVK